MKSYLAVLPAICLLSSNLTHGQPVLSIDINERGQDPTAVTPLGFDAFFIGNVGSTTLAQTNPTTQTFGPISVTISGVGANPNYDDRLRTTPAPTADFTQSLLLRDLIFNNYTGADGGLDITLDGLDADQVYQVTVWSYDTGSARTRVSDWSANGSLVKLGYVFNGSILVTNDNQADQFKFTFKVAASSAGQLAIQGRRNGATASGDPCVFFNALQVEPSVAGATIVTVPPASSTIYTGDNVYFSVEATGTAPITYQWRLDGIDLPDATNRTLLVSQAASDDAGRYSVAVTGLGGTEISLDALLTVLPVTEIASGMVAYWPLDLLTDSSPDLSGMGNDILPTNLSPLNVVPGRFGNAVTFNGADQLLVHTNDGVSGLSVYNFPAYTVALWVKGVGTGQSDRRVFSESSTNNNNPLLNIGTHSSGSSGVVDIYIRNDNGGNPINHRRTSLEAFDGQWHHIAWVDNNGLATVYVDGVADTNDFNYTRGVLTPNITSLGAIQRGTAAAFFNGTIDDAAIWRRALSPAEIQHVKNYGPLLRTAGISIEDGAVSLVIANPRPGAALEVVETTDLANPSWTRVQDVTFGEAMDGTVTATFPAPVGAPRFYRAAYQP